MDSRRLRGSDLTHHLRVTRQFPGLELLARNQDRVVTRAQLALLGADHQVVERRDLAGVWRALGPRVVVLHRGELGRDQRWWTGVLHASLDSDDPRRSAALTGLTAAEAGGLTGFEVPTVHVVVAHGREVGDLVAGRLRVTVHESRRFEAEDVHPTLDPPRMRLHRAVVESAADVAIAMPNRARAIIAAAVQQRLVRPDELRRFAAGRRTLPGRRLLLETIGDAAAGAHSLPEQQLLRGLRRAGLPEPHRQRRLQRADGTWYLDVDFGEYLVTIEVNGLQHYVQTLKEKDDLRRAILQLGGRMVVDLSSYAVRHELATCVLLTAAALESRGYAPSADTRRRLGALAATVGWSDLDLRAS